MRPRSLLRVEFTKSAAPAPRTRALPRCETSKTPAASRTAACSRSTPPPDAPYSIGISQPPKSASLAPRATCRSCRGERSRSVVMRAVWQRRSYPRPWAHRCVGRTASTHPYGRGAGDGIASRQVQSGPPRRSRPPPERRADASRRVGTDAPGPPNGRSTVAELTFALPELDGLDADALVVGTYSSPDGMRLAPGAEAADAALDGRLLAALSAVGAAGEEDDVVKVPAASSSPVPLVVAVGLGAAPEDGAAPDPQRIARAAGAAVRALGGKAKVALALGLTGGEAAAAELTAAVAEGALLGAYTFGAYRTGDRSRSVPPSLVTLLVPDPKVERLDATARRAGIVAAAVALARDLVNTPPNDLPPAELARRAEEAGHAVGLEVEILDEEALATAGFGGVLGVGGGSQRPPRLVRLRHAGSGPKVALVGKGITFDSGGISIKPAAGMDQMKADMAGAAAVVATMTAVAALDLPLDVVATVPMAENLPSGAAYRPADVLTMYGGKRVEVLNTDAEGRLILADAIVRACEDSP